MFQALDEDTIKDFRNIFRSNNERLRCKFFSHPFIIKLWGAIYQRLEKGDKKVKVNPNLKATYSLINEQMRNKFRLNVPDWWDREFPILA